MGISSYSDLQSEIGDWLHRTDLAAKIPTFIQLAEAKIANNIRARQLETAIDLVTVVGQDYVALPADYSSFKNLQVEGAYNTVLTLVPDDTLLKYNADNTQGLPRFYGIQGNNLMLAPVPDSEYTINAVYYQALPILSGANPANWMLTKFPYCYLYGALIEASVYIKDPDQVQFYQGKFNEAIKEVFVESNNASFSGSPLRCVSDYVV